MSNDTANSKPPQPEPSRDVIKRKSVQVVLDRKGAKPGDQATDHIAWFDTVEEAEHFLATDPSIDQDRLLAGDYGIDAPEDC